MRFGFLFLVALFAAGALHSWSNYTYVQVAREVLLDSYPRCAQEIGEGALRPVRIEPVDPVLGEPVNFHCDTLPCPAYDPNYCQTGPRSCASEVKAGQVKNSAKGLCNCEQARELAAAITYFVSKYNPMNIMVRESRECREGFERGVEEAVRKGDSGWAIEYTCDAPAREFTFTERKYNEMVSGARSFAFAEAYSGTSPWFCYTLPKEGDGNGNGLWEGYKEDGELCSTGHECVSGHCDNNVCCSGERCCPVPNVRGYPCNIGEVCSTGYVCSPMSLGDGERCNYGEECGSGHCGESSLTATRKYCCSAGNDYCCASDADCLDDEECINYACMPKALNGDLNGNGDGNGPKPNGNGVNGEGCLPFVILLVVAGGFYAWVRDGGIGKIGA